MTSDAAVVVVDARGMKCPWPALRLARAMRSETRVALLADDPQAGREIAALAGEHGWSVEPEGGGRWLVRRS
nr:sulfurtransferase TusA family protein [Sphingopyxis sp. PET50]